MQKVIFTSLVIAAALPLAAQQVNPCGPGVKSAAAYPELGNLALSVTSVAQLTVVWDAAAGNYQGMATVVRTGATDYDVMSFTWTPGSNAVPTASNYAAGANGAGDEFQGGLSQNLLTLVCDTGVGNPINNGTGAIIGSRANRTAQFGNFRSIVGVAAGYIDPNLGRINGQDVLFWATTASGDIMVGDIDTNPSSATYGVVTNQRQCAAASSAPPTATGLQYYHSPSPQFNAAGNSVGLFYSAYLSGGGSDAIYHSTVNAASYSGLVPQFHMWNDGTDWLANPAVLKGTAYYADAPAGYGDPLRIEAATLTSTRVNGGTGGPVSIDGFLPNGLAGAVVGVIWLDLFSISPVNLGSYHIGNACHLPVVEIPTGPVVNSEVNVSFTMPPVPPGVILAQMHSLNFTTGEIYSSNQSWIEIY